jgi:hypothetical protein
MNPTDQLLLSDLEATWAAFNRFFSRFSEVEWVRAHGVDWMFADVPCHLAVYTRMTANVILMSEDTDIDDTPAILSLEQLHRWNQASLRAIRGAGHGGDGMAQMKAAQDMLRAALTLHDHLDAPVWLMTLRVRGWRTTRLALEYLQWHTWLHLAEAALRFESRLPLLPPSAVRRALDFMMDYNAGAVDGRKATALLGDKPLTWSLELALPESGAAAWTWVIDPQRAPPDERGSLLTGMGAMGGVVEVREGWTELADIAMRADLATYLKTNIFGISSPALMTVMGKLRVKGVGSLGRLQALLYAPPEQIWLPMERGSVKHVQAE